MTDVEAQDILEICARELTEFFDSVQIMGTWVDEQGETHCVKDGIGNWYARQGMAVEFIEEDVAQINADEIANHIDPPDEADTWKNNEDL